MTIQATLYKYGRVVPLPSVGIVTGGAGHLRGLVAAASLRERDLIAVDVYASIFRGPLQLDEMFERLPRNERECGSERLSDSAVALRADVHLPVARENMWIHNGRVFAGALRGIRTLLLDMLAAGAVAALTGNA